MKNKFKIIYIVALTILGFSIVSCKKLLEIPENLPGQLVTVNVFADSTGSVNGVVGIYSKAFGNFGPLSGYLSVYPSMSSDDMTSSSTFYQSIYSNQLTAGDQTNRPVGIGNIWNEFYGTNIIYQANVAIEALNTSTGISGTLRDQLVGECKVVRSLSYFYLTNLFGAVPLATTSNYAVNSKLPRSSSEDVFNFLIKDLTEASAQLSTKYPSADRARPNKYTAMALLSRVYLYREQWKKADSVASVVINSGDYNVENIDNVFLTGSRETIWQGLSTGYTNYVTWEGFNFVPTQATAIPAFPLRDGLLNSFEATDLRKSHWTAYNTIAGVKYYYAYKYKNTNVVRVNGSTESEILFRLAEQYLIRAEARIKLSNLSGATQDIDKIRDRAGLLGTKATTEGALLEAVLKERRAEFFCEWAHRWLDLKRLNLLNSSMLIEKPTTWPVDGHAALYPVPYDQWILNPGWNQNPGY